MYHTPTTGMLECVQQGIPILNPIAEPIPQRDMSLVNTDIVTPESVENTLIKLNLFYNNPETLNTFTIKQFNQYVSQFQDAHSLRTYL